MNMPARTCRPVLAVALVGARAGTPSAATAQSADTTRAYRYMMGTSVQVEALGGDAGTRRAAIEEAFSAIAEVDRLMSNYRDDSELAAINRAAWREPVRVSDPMLAVLQAAARVSAASSGAFDITVGPLVRLWGFHDKQPHLPSPAELAAVRPIVDYRKLLIDPAAHTVRFAQPGMELDLGGIAKGFAVELAASVLRVRGLGGFIDAVGNQYLLGTPPGKHRWSVGVKNPDALDRMLGVIDTAEISVSTSADYANFLTASGRTYGHILDARTLQPSDAALSVTILSRDGTLADAMSKAAFILGPEAGIALIDSTPGLAGVIAYRKRDGTLGLTISPSLKNAFHPVVEPATHRNDRH
jgi:thiamine biosynthesis lipoprotein